jgi:DNA-binding transcriptional LysR family regulator
VQWQFEQNNSVRITPRLNVTTNQDAIDAALAGLGITRVMSYQVAEHLEDGSLVALLDNYERTFSLPINVVHREGRYASTKVRAFVDLIVPKLRSIKALNYEV